MRGIRKSAVLMVLVSCMAVIPLPAVGFPVFSASEFAQQAAQWIDTVNQYVQEAKRWVSEANRLKNQITSINISDWNSWVDTITGSLDIISDWGITSGVLDNILDSSSDTLTSIQRLTNMSIDAYQTGENMHWQMVEKLQNMDWGDPSSWFDNVMEGADTILDFGDYTTQASSAFASGISKSLEEIGTLEMSIELYSAADFESKIQEAWDAAQQARQDFKNALDADQQNAAQQYLQEYTDAMNTYNDLVAQRDEKYERLRELNADYNKAMGRKDEDLNKVSSLFLALYGRADLADTREEFFGKDKSLRKALIGE